MPIALNGCNSKKIAAKFCEHEILCEIYSFTLDILLGIVEKKQPKGDRVKALDFKYKDSCLVSSKEIQSQASKLTSEIKNIQTALSAQYNSDFASLSLITDEQMHATVQTVADEKKRLNPKMMIVIGIGGSNLGAMAICQALKGTLYNDQSDELKVYWADTVDADYIHSIMERMEAALKEGKSVLLTIISKSGATTETAANAQILLALLRQYHPEDYFRYVVAITDKDSQLWNMATQQRFVTLEIPKKVGGRYSVFSAAGLFPLAMLGVDITQLLEGARFLMPDLLDTDIDRNPAALSAIILAYSDKNGKTIHDTFLFSVALESVGKWYRQLMGESIGKEFNRAGQQLYVGITPTVSVGSTDLHSVGQLYMGGPRDKITTFITVENPAVSITVPTDQAYANFGESIQDVPLSDIMQAIIAGIQKAYGKQSLPFMSITLPEISAFYIGQLLQFKMLEIMYLGYLLDINPFDQPQVELYKEETRQIMAHR